MNDAPHWRPWDACTGDPCTCPTLPRTRDVLTEIHAERNRQDRKWGEQNHPDGTGVFPRADRRAADEARRECQTLAAGGFCTWRAILAEEVAEAFAETDPAELRAELVQVAAVAVQWIQAIDRRTHQPK